MAVGGEFAARPCDRQTVLGLNFGHYEFCCVKAILACSIGTIVQHLLALCPSRLPQIQGSQMQKPSSSIFQGTRQYIKEPIMIYNPLFNFTLHKGVPTCLGSTHQARPLDAWKSSPLSEIFACLNRYTKTSNCRYFSILSMHVYGLSRKPGSFSAYEYGISQLEIMLY